MNFNKTLRQLLNQLKAKDQDFQQTNFHVEYWSCSQVLAMQ